MKMDEGKGRRGSVGEMWEGRAIIRTRAGGDAGSDGGKSRLQINLRFGKFGCRRIRIRREHMQLQPIRDLQWE